MAAAASAPPAGPVTLTIVDGAEYRAPGVPGRIERLLGGEPAASAVVIQTNQPATTGAPGVAPAGPPRLPVVLPAVGVVPAAPSAAPAPASVGSSPAASRAAAPAASAPAAGTSSSSSTTTTASAATPSTAGAASAGTRPAVPPPAPGTPRLRAPSTMSGVSSDTEDEEELEPESSKDSCGDRCSLWCGGCSLRCRRGGRWCWRHAEPFCLSADDSGLAPRTEGSGGAPSSELRGDESLCSLLCWCSGFQGFWIDIAILAVAGLVLAAAFAVRAALEDVSVAEDDGSVHWDGAPAWQWLFAIAAWLGVAAAARSVTRVVFRTVEMLFLRRAFVVVYLCSSLEHPVWRIVWSALFSPVWRALLHDARSDVRTILVRIFLFAACTDAVANLSMRLAQGQMQLIGFRDRVRAIQNKLRALRELSAAAVYSARLIRAHIADSAAAVAAASSSSSTTSSATSSATTTTNAGGVAAGTAAPTVPAGGALGAIASHPHLSPSASRENVLDWLGPGYSSSSSSSATATATAAAAAMHPPGLPRVGTWGSSLRQVASAATLSTLTREDSAVDLRRNPLDPWDDLQTYHAGYDDPDHPRNPRSTSAPLSSTAAAAAAAVAAAAASVPLPGSSASSTGSTGAGVAASSSAAAAAPGLHAVDESQIPKTSTLAAPGEGFTSKSTDAYHTSINAVLGDVGEFELYDTKGQLVALHSSTAVRRLANSIFSRLDPARRGVLTDENLTRFGGMSEDGSALTFQIMDYTTMKEISRRDFVLFANQLFRDWRGLARSVQGYDSATRAISVSVRIMWGIVLLFFVISTLGFSASELFLPVLTILVSTSFAAGEPIRNLVLSIIFLVFYHPYDIGDRVSLDFQRTVYVHRIDLLATWFRGMDNKLAMIANHNLLNMRIENHRRSPDAICELTFNIGYRTTPDQLDKLVAAVVAWIRQRRHVWREDVIEFYIYNAHLTGQMTIAFWLMHRLPWHEATIIWADVAKFIALVIDVLKKLGVEYIQPAQPMALGAPGVLAPSIGAQASSVEAWPGHHPSGGHYDANLSHPAPHVPGAAHAPGVASAAGFGAGTSTGTSASASASARNGPMSRGPGGAPFIHGPNINGPPFPVSHPFGSQWPIGGAATPPHGPYGAWFTPGSVPGTASGSAPASGVVASSAAVPFPLPSPHVAPALAPHFSIPAPHLAPAAHSLAQTAAAAAMAAIAGLNPGVELSPHTVAAAMAAAQHAMQSASASASVSLAPLPSSSSSAAALFDGAAFGLHRPSSTASLTSPSALPGLGMVGAELFPGLARASHSSLEALHPSTTVPYSSTLSPTAAESSDAPAPTGFNGMSPPLVPIRVPAAPVPPLSALTVPGLPPIHGPIGGFLHHRAPSSGSAGGVGSSSAAASPSASSVASASGLQKLRNSSALLGPPPTPHRVGRDARDPGAEASWSTEGWDGTGGDGPGGGASSGRVTASSSVGPIPLAPRSVADEGATPSVDPVPRNHPATAGRSDSVHRPFSRPTGAAVDAAAAAAHVPRFRSPPASAPAPAGLDSPHSDAFDATDIDFVAGSGATARDEGAGARRVGRPPALSRSLPDLLRAGDSVDVVPAGLLAPSGGALGPRPASAVTSPRRSSLAPSPSAGGAPPSSLLGRRGSQAALGGSTRSSSPLPSTDGLDPTTAEAALLLAATEPPHGLEPVDFSRELALFNFDAIRYAEQFVDIRSGPVSHTWNWRRPLRFRDAVQRDPRLTEPQPSSTGTGASGSHAVQHLTTIRKRRVPPALD